MPDPNKIRRSSIDVSSHVDPPSTAIQVSILEADARVLPRLASWLVPIWALSSLSFLVSLPSLVTGFVGNGKLLMLIPLPGLCHVGIAQRAVESDPGLQGSLENDMQRLDDGRV